MSNLAVGLALLCFGMALFIYLRSRATPAPVITASPSAVSDDADAPFSRISPGSRRSASFARMSPVAHGSAYPQGEGLFRYIHRLERARRRPGAEEKLLADLRENMEKYHVDRVEERIASVQRVIERARKMSDEDFEAHKRALAIQIRTKAGVAEARMNPSSPSAD
jgi:hypothetical protein